MDAPSSPIPPQNAAHERSDDRERRAASTSGTNWHQLPASEVLDRLGSDIGFGLSNAEAQGRIAQFGPNELPETEGRGIGRILWDQISEMMVVILLAAGVVSLALGDMKDAIVIFAIVVLNAGFGLVQEYRAEKAISAMRRLAAPAAKARRDGAVEILPSRHLVPGDIVLLEAGDIVGADCRLLEAVNLQMNEAPLTGESVPVIKTKAPLPPEPTLLHDRKNMVYLGTSVSIGRGTAVVTETGSRTELGRIADLLGRSKHESTPLQKRLAELARGLAVVIFFLVAVIFGLGLLRGEPLALMFLTAVSMAVAAVPEGLPAVVTIVLAVGAQRMLRRRALIRTLPAAETLGSVTVICSDKTGTLTENRMAVTSLETAGHVIENFHENFVATTPSIALLLAAGALCNDSRPEGRSGGPTALFGDPMEIALAAAAGMARLDKAELETAFPRVAEIPFDPVRKRMTTVHRVPPNLPARFRDETLPLAPGSFIAFTKGALESVLEVSDRRRADEREEQLDPATRTAIRLAGERLARTGRRVLGFAYRKVLCVESPSADEHHLVFLGMVGLSDPIRAEVKSAVQLCRAAGIRPVMITGDHPFTAQHVAHELALDGPILSGVELEAMPDDHLEALVDEIGVYARVLPEHKFRIVRALQARGHVVSMTGDGVNDAPALKQADIGVAMGITGTDVTKQASDMVLLDDNFATIVAAVEEGRVIYDNIRKFIRYVLAGNVGELFVMLFGPLIGLSLPMMPLQILWINLASDGLNGLALSVEPAERDTMNRPPRCAGESIFGGGMVRHIVGVGALLGIVSLAVGFFFWCRRDSAWQAATFLTLASGQCFQTLAARSWRDSIFRLRFTSNPLSLVSVMLSLASTLAIVYVPPLQNLFNTVSLSGGRLLAILLVSTIPFWAIELEKWHIRRSP